MVPRKHVSHWKIKTGITTVSLKICETWNFPLQKRKHPATPGAFLKHSAPGASTKQGAALSRKNGQGFAFFFLRRIHAAAYALYSLETIEKRFWR